MKSMTKKTRTFIAVSVIVVIAVSVGATVLSTANKQKVSAEPVYKETKVEKGNLTVGVTESGSAATGSVTQTFDLTLTSTSGSSSTPASSASTNAASSAVAGSKSTALIVEMVYVATGQEVKKGDSLLKLTDASIVTAKATLEAAVASAELTLKQKMIDREDARLTATYTLKANQALGTNAKAEYDATINALAVAVSSAEANLATTKARIAAIPKEITAANKELTALENAATPNSSEIATKQKEIESLTTELANAKDKLSSLTAAVSKAKRDQTTQTITAKKKYDESLLTFQNADVLYHIALNGIDDGVETATEALATAQENLQEFTAFVGKGDVVSAYTGKLTAVGYAAGATLSSATAIATFLDPAAVTVSVSVAQDDISVVTVGNPVNVTFTAYKDLTFLGTVTSIATATTSRSATVSYPVVVILTGDDVDKIYASMTGSVTFITKQLKDVLYVSNKAITVEGTRSFVKMRDASGSVQTVEVTTGFSNGYQVEILSGLKQGDVVLIESQVSST